MAYPDMNIILHMVASVDGIIAKPDNSVDWFETASDYENGIDIHENDQSSADCYVMGSRTYEHGVELSKTYGWVYGDTPTIVLTSRNLHDDRPNVAFWSGDLQTLVREKLKPYYREVWVVGGAALIRSFLQQKLAHELRINILPILLGNGLPFFDRIGVEQPLDLRDVKTYRNGMIEMSYTVRA